MTYNALNYFRQGDGALVLGGKVVDGGGAEIEAPRLLQYACVPITGLDSTSGGAIGSWVNPTGKNIIVQSPVLDIATASAGAATIDIGVAADDETTSDTLFDGVTVNGSITGQYEAPSGAGSNDEGVRKMSATQAITVTGSANTTGLAGILLIPYMVLDV